MAVRPEPLRDLDWPPDRAAAFGERAVELWREFLQTLPSRPVAHRLSEQEVRNVVALDIPDQPMDDDALLEHVRSVIDHSMYPGHPRFMAYISGAGTVPGVAADFLAAALNQNLGGWRLSPAATEIELHLTRWFARLFGLPETGGGLLVSGGAMANFVPLKTARDRKAGWDIRTEGVAGGPPLVLYASEEVHAVVDRAADMLGLGMQALRKIPVGDDYRMRMEVLEKRLQEDIDAGRRPFCIVGTAGTVATGTIDPLEEIADLCERHDLWFHADAAYGGPAVLADDLRHLFAGIERADSIAFDPHKWLYTPHSGGCAVFRDLQHLADSFAIHPTYVHEDKERTGHGLDLSMLGPQFSRGFQAFKVWLSLLAHGTAAYGRRISHDAALARYMGELVEERPDFELMAPVGLSICCFRYRPPDLPPSAIEDEYLSLLNERLMTEIQLDGRAFCSNAVLGGRFVLRACIVNFRTEAEDVEATLEVAAELGERLDKELRPATLRGRT
jgi:glutamate/tyrosine decarboxylase-like PLP-dependent enzyme